MSTISLSAAMTEPALKLNPEAAAKEETLVWAMSQVLLHERLQVPILIPGVESIGPGRKLSPSLIKVMARKGFMIDDPKLNDMVAARIGEYVATRPASQYPLRTAALAGDKPPRPQSWKSLGAGGLPAVETLAHTHDLRTAAHRIGGRGR